MPLSAPEDRELKHRRVVVCEGYERRDGLWDIEGHITDTKTYPYDNGDSGMLDPGEPVHDMRLRLTLDASLKVVRAEAVTDASPFRACPQAAPSFQQLEGLHIRPGWLLKVKERLGGPKGCTHLVELLGPMATVAFQTVLSGQVSAVGDAQPQPLLLDSCRAFDAKGDLARQLWPEHLSNRE